MLDFNFGGSKPRESHFPPVTSLPSDIRELLEQYSSIPSAEVMQHIEEVVRLLLILTLFYTARYTATLVTFA